MKEEALKLADELQDYMTSLGWKTHQAPNMIRRLVKELDKQDYRRTHEGFSTIIDKVTPQTKLQEWRYLTDAEIKEIIGSYGDGIGGYTRELFDKIEAKIREKNDS